MKVKNSLFIGLAILSLISCVNSNKNQDDSKDSIGVVSADPQKFKKEYESVNGTKSKAGKTFIDVSIPEDSRIIYATEEDVLNLDSGIVLFGFPTCPWCRNAVEPLLEFARDEQVDIYYVNIRNIRDKKELKEGKIITTEEGTKGYHAIVKKFNDILNPYPDLEVDSIKRLVSPTVLYIKDNKATHKIVGTVKSQTDPYIKLTEEQHKELKQLYKNPICGCDE